MTVAVTKTPLAPRRRKARSGSPPQTGQSAGGLQRVPMSYEDYLDRFSEGGIVEWANEEAVMHMPPSTRHQDVSDFILAVLRQYVEFLRLGQVLSAPFEMKLGDSLPSREPDILFVDRTNLDRLTDLKLVGPADLVVEIVSSSTAAHDRATKFEEYQEAGVREYWLIDPRPGKERADFWVLAGDGRYRPVPPEESGIYRSTVVPGFWLDTGWLQERTLPQVLFTLATILDWPDDIVARLRALQGA